MDVVTHTNPGPDARARTNAGLQPDYARVGWKLLARFGLTGAVVAASIVLAACGGTMPRACGGTTASAKLVTSYRPAQTTGWEPPYNQTIGGHVVSEVVSYGQKKFRLALLGFGPATKCPNPVYEAVPGDPRVVFKKTLGRTWNRDYAFRYLDGLPNGARFVMESNSVWLAKNPTSLSFGADVYVVYQPGRSRARLPINSELQFIQVICTTAPQPEAPGGTAAPPGSFVDSRRHPFYGEGAGLTSLNGKQVVSFYDDPHLGGPVKTLSVQIVRAETFLVQTTGKKNSAGKEIVNIYGGVRWGFELEPIN